MNKGIGTFTEKSKQLSEIQLTTENVNNKFISNKLNIIVLHFLKTIQLFLG